MPRRKRASYYYKPSKKIQSNWPIYKKLIKSLILSCIILLIAYFWAVTVLPNISNFWRVFKGSSKIYNTADLIPPRRPVILEIPLATNKSKIDIKGKAEVASTVKLYVNKKELKKTLTDNDGVFTFNDVPLREGENSIYAVSIDAAGNVSEQSRNHIVVLDTKEPSIAILKPNVLDIREPTNAYTIEGKTEPKAIVTVNGQRASIDSEGVFKITVSLKEGGNDFKIEVRDEAGNKTTKDLHINYEKKEE